MTGRRELFVLDFQQTPPSHRYQPAVEVVTEETRRQPLHGVGHGSHANLFVWLACPSPTQ